MAHTGRSWSLSAILLALSGVTLIGAGLYFLLLRPPLLPEDLRYMGLEPAQVAAIGPRMEPWLAHVFRVMGGYVLATGVLAITLATTSFRLHEWGAGLGALVGGAASIGLMATTNFIIGSDFKWTLLGMAALWAASLVAFALERSRSSHELRQSPCTPDV
jgi:hypothetical protein